METEKINSGRSAKKSTKKLGVVVSPLTKSIRMSKQSKKFCLAKFNERTNILLMNYLIV